jgi:hypothetical protein
MATLHMGYLGYAKITPSGGTAVYYPITGSSLNPVQGVDAPDLVVGHEVRRGYNYSKIEIGGNITGPFHENAASLWKSAYNRSTSGDDAHDHLDDDVKVEITYYFSKGRSFNNCYVNSLQISATAGDVTNFTADFIGYKPEGGSALSDITTQTHSSGISGGDSVTCAKLVTWDRVKLASADLPTDSQIQSFTLTLSNNLQRGYSITDGTGDLHPIDVPAGFREISGSISLYAQTGLSDSDFSYATGTDTKFGAEDFNNYTAGTLSDIEFEVGVGLTSPPVPSTTFKARFHRPEAAAQTSLTIYTLNFTAVCDTGPDVP